MSIEGPERGPSWDERAALDPLAAVLDPDGRTAAKNRLIDRVQRRAIGRVVGSPRGLRVLDFGCGTGRLGRWLQAEGARVVGLDSSPGMLVRARGAMGPVVALYDGRHLPLRAASTDLVLSVGVLQYFAGGRLDEALASLASLLHPGGRLVLVEQVNEGTLGHGFPPSRYRDALRGAGLVVVSERTVRRGRSLVTAAAERWPWVAGTPGSAALAGAWAGWRGPGDLHGDGYADVLYLARRA